MFNLQDPFFRPLWIRLAVVASCLGWAILEVVTGSPGWAVMFAAIGLYAAYQFFIVWTNPDKGD